MLNIDGIPSIPKPQNAPLLGFAKGTNERKLLEEAIRELRAQNPEEVKLPLIIGGQEIMTDDLGSCVVPHNRHRILGRYAKADSGHVASAIQAVLDAREKWAQVPWYIRLNIFRKAAYLLQTKYFYKAMAVTMEDYSKTPYEAMIDVCELIDFWNFNAYYAYQIYQEQPDTPSHNFNFTDWRPLEGFVAALPPNNFMAITGNLPTAPLIMGNVVVCKPASDVVFSMHFLLKVLYEAGLPREVLSVIHGDSKMIGEIILNNPELSGVHFTGSTNVFDRIVGKIGENTRENIYRGYPHRSCVGETGGKNALVVYDDESPRAAAASIVVGGFGYQGRKCSATSRVYITNEMWQKVKPHLLEFMGLIKRGDVADFKNYLGAVINEKEYEKIASYIYSAKLSSQITVMGGLHDDETGWFIAPTIILTNKPNYTTMKEEIFGPVVTVCLMDKDKFQKVLETCDKTSPYGLTAAVDTRDIFQLCEGLQALRYAAGNIYDWKTTGAVVGQQPFGGTRKSGTDDKAGSKLNLYKWTAPRAISLSHNKPESPWPAYLDLD